MNMKYCFFLIFITAIENRILCFDFVFPNTAVTLFTINGSSELKYEALVGQTLIIQCSLNDGVTNISNVAIFDNNNTTLNRTINYKDNLVEAVVFNVTAKYNGWFRCRDLTRPDSPKLLASCEVTVGYAVAAPSVTCVFLNQTELVCLIEPSFLQLLSDTGFPLLVFDLFESQALQFDFGGGFVNPCSSQCAYQNVTYDKFIVYPEKASIKVGPEIMMNITVCVGKKPETIRFCSPSVINTLNSADIVKPAAVKLPLFASATDNSVDLTLVDVTRNWSDYTVYARNIIDGNMLKNATLDNSRLKLRDLLPGTEYNVEIALRYKELSLDFVTNRSDVAVGLLSDWSQSVTFRTLERLPLALTYVGIQRRTVYCIYWQIPPLKELGGALVEVRTQAVGLDGSNKVIPSGSSWTSSAEKNISGVRIDLKNGLGFGKEYFLNLSHFTPELDLAEVDIIQLENSSYMARVRLPLSAGALSNFVLLWACLASSMSLQPCDQPIAIHAMNLSGISSKVMFNLNLPSSFISGSASSNNKVYFSVSWFDGVTRSFMSSWNSCVFKFKDVLTVRSPFEGNTSYRCFNLRTKCIANVTINLKECQSFSDVLVSHFKIEAYIKANKDKALTPTKSATYVINSTQRIFHLYDEVPLFYTLFVNVTAFYVDGQFAIVYTKEMDVGGSEILQWWHLLIILIIVLSIIGFLVYRLCYRDKGLLYYIFNRKRMEADSSIVYKTRYHDGFDFDNHAHGNDAASSNDFTRITVVNIDSSKSYPSDYTVSQPIKKEVGNNEFVVPRNPLKSELSIPSPPMECTIDPEAIFNVPLFDTPMSSSSSNYHAKYATFDSSLDSDETRSGSVIGYAKVTRGDQECNKEFATAHELTAQSQMQTL